MNANQAFDRASFLATLWSVNWVEKRADREAAIRTGAKDLCTELATALCDAVRSFQNRYRHGTYRDCKSSSHGVTVKKTVNKPGLCGAPNQEIVSLVYHFDENPFAVTLDGYTGRLQRYDLLFLVDADENGKAFFRRKGSTDPLTVEQISEITLEEFLFSED